MGNLAHPSFPSMESDFQPVFADSRQLHTAPLSFTSLEEPIIHTTAKTIPSLSFYASLISASLSDAPHEPQAKSLHDLPISKTPEQRVKPIPAIINYVPETRTQHHRKKNRAEKAIKIQFTQPDSLRFNFTSNSANTEKKILTLPKATTPITTISPLCSSILVTMHSTSWAQTSQLYSKSMRTKWTKAHHTEPLSGKKTNQPSTISYTYFNPYTSQWIKSTSPPKYKPRQSQQLKSIDTRISPKTIFSKDTKVEEQRIKSDTRQVPPTVSNTSRLKDILKIEKEDSKQWGLLALSSSDSDEPSSSRKSVTMSTSSLNFPQISKFKKTTYNGKPASKYIGTINDSEDTPLFSAALVPFHNPSAQYFEVPKMQRSFPARTIFYKQRGSAHKEKSCTPPIFSHSIPSKQNYSILMNKTSENSIQSSSNQKHSVLIRKESPTSKAKQDEVEISSNSANKSRNQNESVANFVQLLDERFEILLAAIKSRNNPSK